ncbi:MAG TPA: hypothetical protein VMT34_11960 [Aggregatilineales bacterium]|nr:hypothetical protein [Aggregatilineales bacterium]
MLKRKVATIALLLTLLASGYGLVHGIQAGLSHHAVPADPPYPPIGPWK